MVALVKSEHSISYSSINSTPRGSFLDNSAFSGITGLNIGASYNHNSGLDVINESYSQKNSDQETFNHGIMNPNKIVLSLDENNRVRTFFLIAIYKTDALLCFNQVLIIVEICTYYFIMLEIINCFMQGSIFSSESMQRIGVDTDS
jgi:hypothetical protein